MSTYKIIVMVLFTLLSVCLADIWMAKGYYNIHDIKGWMVFRQWSKRRAGYLKCMGLVFLLVLVALFIGRYLDL